MKIRKTDGNNIMQSITFQRIFYFILLATVIFSVIVIGCRYRKVTGNAENQEISQHQFSSDPVHIRGFIFEWNENGKKLLSIKADEFSVEKHKFGFFRLGFVNMARFQNAVIEIFFDAMSKGEGAGSDKSQSEPTFNPSNLEKVFKTKNLFSVPVKRVSSVVIEPVCFRFYEEESLMTQISADFATVRPRHRDILLKGNVRVASGKRILMTGRLIVVLENGTIQTDDFFVLQTPQRMLQGKRLFTDFLLDIPLHSDQPFHGNVRF